jgi:hypothetical protein
MFLKKKQSLFLNTLFCIGLFQACTQVYAIPVNLVATQSSGIKYPIYVACECDYSLYVDDKYIEHDKTEVKSFDYLETGWNSTKRFYPFIYDESPKIIAFNGNGIAGEYAGLLNGFMMDMNDGKDYTKYQEWKCADFSKTESKAPPVNWFTFDYDDSNWTISTSFGKNYQNNSFQIFETERREINLQAEWLWTSDNSVTNVYCRKKNENVKTIPTALTTVPAQTSAPTRVSTTIHTPAPVQTSAPTVVQTSAPSHVSTTIHTPTRMQTSAPSHVQTSAPSHVSTTIHTPAPVQTSAPAPVQTSARPNTVPNIVISPHIQIIIQNIKYSQMRSNTHIHNLFRKLKLYNDEYTLYKQLTIVRLHLRQHYNALFYDIKHVLEKQNIYDSAPNLRKKTVKNTPYYIHSMYRLNKTIEKIEESIKFITGNHKYILLKILNKLKTRYQHDTEQLFKLTRYTE